jgi:hypothetical protein
LGVRGFRRSLNRSNGFRFLDFGRFAAPKTLSESPSHKGVVVIVGTVVRSREVGLRRPPVMHSPHRLGTQSGACRGPNIGPPKRNVALDHEKSLRFASNTASAGRHGERIAKEHEKLNPSFSGRSRITLARTESKWSLSRCEDRPLIGTKPALARSFPVGFGIRGQIRKPQDRLLPGSFKRNWKRVSMVASQGPQRGSKNFA